MFENISRGIDNAKMVGECKRDFEKEIKNANEKLRKVVTFKNAVFDYTGEYARIHGNLAEMVGELVYEEMAMVNTIKSLLEQQNAAAKALA